MVTWAKVILAVLSLIEKLLDEAEKRHWLNEGEKRQIAKALAEQTRKTEYAQQTLAEISKLNDADTDALLRTLEGPAEPGDGKR